MMRTHHHLLVVLAVTAGSLASAPAAAQTPVDATPQRGASSSVYYGNDPVDGQTPDSWYGYNHIGHCIGGPVDNFFVNDKCFGDQTQEQDKHEQGRALDRWVKAGLLSVGALWSAVHSAKQIWSSSRDLYHLYQSIAANFDRHLPAVTVMRLANATDNVADRISDVEEIETNHKLPGSNNPRYNQIDMLVLRALATSKDGQEAALSLNDQASGMQMRIEGNDVTFVNLNGSKDSSRAGGALPPLPSDAPASALAEYTSNDGAPAAAARLSITPNTGAGAMFTAAGPNRGAGGTPSSTPTACAVGEDQDTMDPSVMFQRAVVAARGAQTAASATSSDVSVAREEIRTLITREKQAQDESLWAIVGQFLGAI